jgi:hypothetical protein
MGGGNSPMTSPSIFNNQSYFADITVASDENNNPNRNIMFSIVSVVPVPGMVASQQSPGTYVQQYGVIDEGSKLNINAWAAIDPTGNALYEALLLLPYMQENQQTAANIVAYVLPATAPPLTGASGGTAIVTSSGVASGTSGNSAPAGVTTSYYESLQYPYQAKNGPLNSLDELLLVDGVTPGLLFGNDQNQSGMANTSSPSSAGTVDRGWQDYLTVNGRELNVNMTGGLRIYLNGSSLSGIQAALQNSTVDQNMQTYIMGALLYGTTTVKVATPTKTTMGGGGGGGAKVRQGAISDLETAVNNSLQNSSSTPKPKPIASIADLANTQVLFPDPTGQKGDMVMVASPLTTSTMAQYLPNLLDQVTLLGKGGSVQVELTPRINVSTASTQVLSMLPVLTPTDVSSLVSAQAGLMAGDPANTSGAWMVTTGGLSLSKYQAISKYVTGTSMLYRVQAVGYYSGIETSGSNGTNATNWPMARVEALIDTNMGFPRIVYIRDLTSLDSPRAFNLPLQQTQQ